MLLHHRITQSRFYFEQHYGGDTQRTSAASDEEGDSERRKMNFLRSIFSRGGGGVCTRRHQEEYENRSDEGGTIKQMDDSARSDLDSNICENWGQEHYHKSLQFWTKKSADLSHKCHVLEEQAKERDIEDRYSRERIQSLEKQLERLLVEKGTTGDAAGTGGKYCQAVTSSSSSDTMATAPLSPSNSLLTGCDSKEFKQDELAGLDSGRNMEDARREISSLEELLSKVLAENKVLTSKCDNLSSILKDNSTSNNMSLPPDITDLDSVLELNRSVTPHEMTKRKPLIYHLQCRKCKEFHYIGQTAGEVIHKVDEHFDDVWRKCQENKNPNSVVRFISTEFGRSEFIKHVAHHNRDAKSRGDVRKWCKDHVKIAILTGENKKINIDGWLLMLTLLDAAEKERDEAVRDADGPQKMYSRVPKDVAKTAKKSMKMPPPKMSFFN